VNPPASRPLYPPNKKGDNPQGYALGYCRDLLGASMHLALRASTCGAVRRCSCSAREPSGFKTVVTPNKKGDNPQGYALGYCRDLLGASMHLALRASTCGAVRRCSCSAREPSGFKTVVTPNKKGDNPLGYALSYMPGLTRCIHAPRPPGQHLRRCSALLLQRS